MVVVVSLVKVMKALIHRQQIRTLIIQVQRKEARVVVVVSLVKVMKALVHRQQIRTLIIQVQRKEARVVVVVSLVRVMKVVHRQQVRTLIIQVQRKEARLVASLEQGRKSGTGSGAKGVVSVENEPVSKQEETPVGPELIQKSMSEPEASPESLGRYQKKSGGDFAKGGLECHA